MPISAKPSKTTWSDDDDEFPDLDALVSSKKLQSQADTSRVRKEPKARSSTEEAAKPATTIRRRKLVPLTDNLLLRAWTPDNVDDGPEEKNVRRERESSQPRRTRVELRTRNTKPAVAIPSSPADQEEDEYVSAQEEVTIIEDVSMFDDSFHSCASEGSEFSGYDEEEDDDDVFGAATPPRRSPAKPRLRKNGKQSARTRDLLSDEGSTLRREEEDASHPDSKRVSSRRQEAESKTGTGRKGEGKTKKPAKDLADTLSRLRLDETEEKPRRAKPPKPSDDKVIPPSTPPKARTGLVSPRKLPRIPITPHRPSSDMFWSQEFVDDWNDEHSPRKQLFPDAAPARQRSPTKTSPEKKSQKSTDAKQPSNRAAKKAFEQAKHDLAAKFLQELDDTITNGKLAELSASTGGIKLIWTNKLNTTAGRANWKRETIRHRHPDNPSSFTAANTPKYKHHASIELAEKVIDSEHRLVNVLAHEFCHLANFMISGVTTNPHGREFKAWAAQCSRVFGSTRGVQVTTKHSYDIDFKYVWRCVECAMEFKRHSKSIDPARHRCGGCKGGLEQVRPVPRGGNKSKDKGGGGGEGGGKVVSEYQAFVKEQMRVVKGENPGSPQKEIMRIVAGRWAARKEKGLGREGEEGVKEVVEGMEELAV